VKCGVPQESVLGPILFVSYINDVSRVIKYSRFHIYADDLRINHSSSVEIHEWATANGLKLNPEKSRVIFKHRCRADIPPPTFC
jgi:hypothetical protein